MASTDLFVLGRNYLMTAVLCFQSVKFSAIYILELRHLFLKTTLLVRHFLQLLLRLSQIFVQNLAVVFGLL